MSRTFAVICAVLVLVVVLSIAAMVWLPASLYFPIIKFRHGAELDVTFFGTGFANIKACTIKSDELVKPLLQSRTGIISASCVKGLDDKSRKVFSRAPLDAPSIRMWNGVVVVFRSQEPRLSMEACKQSEASSSVLIAEKQLKCIPAGTPR